jgi:hypothetical protein
MAIRLATTPITMNQCQLELTGVSPVDRVEFFRDARIFVYWWGGRRAQPTAQS